MSSYFIIFCFLSILRILLSVLFGCLPDYKGHNLVFSHTAELCVWRNRRHFWVCVDGQMNGGSRRGLEPKRNKKPTKSTVLYCLGGGALSRARLDERQNSFLFYPGHLVPKVCF